MGHKHSAATRKKLRDANIQAALERHAEGGEENITHKVCTGCKELLPVEDFNVRKEKLKCGLIAVRPEPKCRDCNAKRWQDWRARKEAEGFDFNAYKRELFANRSQAQKRRADERNRENAARKRREEGKRVIGPRVRRDERKRRPVGPVHEYLIGLLESHSKAEIATRSGLTERHLLRIEKKEERNVHIDEIDALVLAFDGPDKLNEMYPVEEEERLVGYHVLDPEGLLADLGP